MHLLAEELLLERDDGGFQEEGVKAYLMAPLSPLNSPTYLCLHIYSLRFILTKVTYTSVK